MSKVTVYSFLISDQGKQIQVPSKRTIRDIETLGGVVVAGTAEKVDESELREDGRYLPKHVKEDDFHAVSIVPANRA